MTDESVPAQPSRLRAVAVAIVVSAAIALVGVVGGLFGSSVGLWTLGLAAPLVGVVVLSRLSRGADHRAVFISLGIFGAAFVVVGALDWIGFPIGVPAAITLATGLAASYALKFRSIETMQRRTSWVIGAFAIAWALSLGLSTAAAAVVSAPLAFIAVGVADLKLGAEAT